LPDGEGVCANAESVSVSDSIKIFQCMIVYVAWKRTTNPGGSASPETMSNFCAFGA
jgi:hypothetical protein